MKTYTITCSEEQMRLLRSAVELQMRIRFGQGWAITDNLMPITRNDYRTVKDLYDPVLNQMLEQIVMQDGYRNRIRPELADNRSTERDMWIALECGLNLRNDPVYLSDIPPLKVEVSEV